MKLSITLIALHFLFGLQSIAQSISELPIYNEDTLRIQQDWLVQHIDQKTVFYQDQQQQLVMCNGLISRVFSLKPDGATVAFDNLLTGENMLRSVRPEAEVVIDGIHLVVGGLTGQPVQNYLLPEWLAQMKPNSLALHLSGFETGKTEPRFGWKKHLNWMASDLPWPAPGASVTFHYQAADQLIAQLSARSLTDKGRNSLFEDNFQTLSKHWHIFASSSDDRNSFMNEGKPGEIFALTNAAVYADLKLPQEAQVFIVKLNPGTDLGASWGPGMGLVFKGQVLKVNIRPHQNEFGLFDGKQELTLPGIQEGKSVWLRMELQTDVLICSYSYDGEQYTLLGKMKLPDDETPEFLRIGKMDQFGNNTDHSETGESGRSRIEKVIILGSLSKEARQSQQNRFTFLKKVIVNVHYEMYDGMPLLSKWITIDNQSNQPITIDTFKSEILATAEPESEVDSKSRWILPNMTVDTDYRFGGMSNDNLYDCSVAWNPDPEYLTQVNYERTMPALLECYPKIGPAQELKPGESMESFRTWELLHDSWDRERKGLAKRRMYRSQAPWVTENPILMHVRQADDASVQKAIDQCASVGFEMVIMTFGSGFDIEDTSQTNLDRMKTLAEYAHNQGIALGGYSLLASRKIGDGQDVVMPEGKTPRFGNSPCLESKWGQQYFKTLYKFYEKTGQDILEHDGSYPGDVCAATHHPGHTGLEDSQWKQFNEIKTFYEWCREKGIYLNVPDFYFMNGSNKTGMGYRETNWSLPRAQQEIIERQNIYDGTWEKTPSMGWMFVPLVEYQGGGAAATIEPLKDHLPHYEQRLANLFGAGVQACYRGPELYDVPETQAIVQKWVSFYKNHRQVLDGDIIHIRRPDGRDYDAILHVNPFGKEKGLLMVYNPRNESISRKIKVTLYYTGLTNEVKVTNEHGESHKFALSRDYYIEIPVTIPAHSQEWFVLK